MLIKIITDQLIDNYFTNLQNLNKVRWVLETFVKSFWSSARVVPLLFGRMVVEDVDWINCGQVLVALMIILAFTMQSVCFGFGLIQFLYSFSAADVINMDTSNLAKVFKPIDNRLV